MSSVLFEGINTLFVTHRYEPLSSPLICDFLSKPSRNELYEETEADFVVGTLIAIMFTV